MCKQVSRLGFILPGRLPAFRQWPIPLRQLHGYWDSPGIAPVFPSFRAERCFRTNTHAIHLHCDYTRWSGPCQQGIRALKQRPTPSYLSVLWLTIGFPVRGTFPLPAPH